MLIQGRHVLRREGRGNSTTRSGWSSAWGVGIHVPCHPVYRNRPCRSAFRDPRMRKSFRSTRSLMLAIIGSSPPEHQDGGLQPGCRSLTRGGRTSWNGRPDALETHTCLTVRPSARRSGGRTDAPFTVPRPPGPSPPGSEEMPPPRTRQSSSGRSNSPQRTGCSEKNCPYGPSIKPAPHRAVRRDMRSLA